MELATLLAETPGAHELAPYHPRYMALVTGRNILETLTSQMTEAMTLLSPVGETRAEHRYAEGKWSLKEVVNHIADTERVFAYRALRIARGDTTERAGFDHDPFVLNGPAARMTFADVLVDWSAVRRSTLTLLRPLSAEAWMRIAPVDRHPVSVRALAFLTAGHAEWHLDILRARYLA
jgi:hypothetical protein